MNSSAKFLLLVIFSIALAVVVSISLDKSASNFELDKELRPALSLADAYEKGIEKPKDLATARYYYQVAAEKGGAEAYKAIAGFVYRTALNPGDYNAAAQWYFKATESGDKEAKYKLGTLIQRRIAAQVNQKTGLDWLREAADAGHPEAMVEVGQTLEARGEYKSAFRYYSAAAFSGEAAAYLPLSDFYKFGRGVKPDKVKSFQYLRMAANAEIPVAQFNLANALKQWSTPNQESGCNW